MSSETHSVGLFKNKGLVSLDALRAIAALSVAIPHYFLFQGRASAALEFTSIMAVEVFFALSGFVLARQLIFCVESSSWRNLFVFYSRRWMRTLPPYLIVLVFLSIATREILSGDFWRYAFFVRNLIAIDPQDDYFTVAWSLAVEEWFYLLFPPFLIVLTRARLSILTTALVFVGLLFVAKIAYLAASPEQFEQRDELSRFGSIRSHLDSYWPF